MANAKNNKTDEDFNISDAEFERQFNAARKKGAVSRPAVEAATLSYDPNSDLLSIELKNGAIFSVPSRLLQEFNNASAEDISRAEIMPGGRDLHWDHLDQHMSVAGLIASGLGTQVSMAELGRRGGSVTTDAKAYAARENGRKGGRPPLVRAAAAAATSTSLIVQAATRQADIDHIDIAVSGGSQQSVRDLAKYETGLVTAQRPMGRSTSIPSAVVRSDKPAFLVHAVASLSGEPLEEGDDDAELPVAA